MKKSKLVRFTAAALAAGMVVPSMAVYAEPTVITETGEEIEDASAIDDEEAVESVDDSFQSNEIADPEEAAEYLLENQEDEVISQTPTDERDTSLPEKFDLRDKGVVTPVKQQSPFGTCWGFSAIAACETSILSAMGKTYEETGLDLSEHQLAYFARTYLQDGSSQDGEGVHMVEGFEDNALNTGGQMFTATSMFSSGMGPVDEELIPYRGKNSNTYGIGPLNICYDSDDDWTIPAEYEFVQSYTLKESNELPSPAVYTPGFNAGSESSDEDSREENYVGYDASATDAWKRELMDGKAISIAFSADTYLPGQDGSGTALYLNTEDGQWTHYTFDGGLANHGVTIVGWDDTIPASSFLDHTDDEYGDGQAHQPEGDGAWIVKNSWGASEEAFPNNYDWGVDGSGYFYISYYDRSLCMAETFDFEIKEDDSPMYELDQYDYLQADETEGWVDENGLQMANVFTAEEDGEIAAVSCQTNSVNVSVTYQIYMMDDEDKVPTEGELVSTFDEDYEYAGYHKENLENPITVQKGQKYAVVVTSCFTDGDTVYYEFETTTGISKEYVEEYNRKVRYRNRGESDPDVAESQLIQFYYQGVVNEGESYVYMDELGQWGDLGQIVPYLRESDDYAIWTFDNFPIKAYITLADPEAVAAEEGGDLPDLGYAAPGTALNKGFIVEVLVGALVIVVIILLLVILLVRSAKKKKAKKAHIKELEEKVPVLEAEVARLKALAGDADTENSDAAAGEASSEAQADAQSTPVPETAQAETESKDSEI